jgi:malate synthase
MGGMAAQIPIKNNVAANEKAMDKVRADKLREVRAGHDGTWVAHPDLVKLAKSVFDEHMIGPHQLYIQRTDNVTASDLITTKGIKGGITENGIRTNISIALLYMESWLRGVGCVPIHNLMEDAATAEISRSQLWQWVKHGAKTDQGRIVTKSLVNQMLDEEINKIRRTVGEERFGKSQFEQAARLLGGTIQGGAYADFLTSLCYGSLVSVRSKL